MSGASEVPVGGIGKGKSPKTPKGRNLVQGRLPFAVVDNKSPVTKTPETKSKLTVDAKPEKEESIKPTNKEEKPCIEVIEPDVAEEKPYVEDVKPESPCAGSDDSSSLQDLSTADAEDPSAAEQDSELNESCITIEDADKSIDLTKKMTPRQVEKKKKKLERLREKEERDRKKAEEIAKKERLRKEKEEEKKKKDEEKEAEKKRKEEEKKKKDEEREADRKRKEEEKKKKEEEKEADRKKKEEEKKRKEEEKELEKKKKEEDELKKKQRLSQVFTNFFTQKKTTPAKSEKAAAECTVALAFPPFQIKDNMKLAPTVRSLFDSDRRKVLDEALVNGATSSLNYNNRGRKCGATWPLNKESEVEIIDEDDAPVDRDDNIITLTPAVPRRMRAKLLKFTENRRPAYWGTWGKTSQTVGPRRPFGKEVIFDYEIDSDDEWEEEVEPGESLTDSEGEGEEKEPADDYEVDNEFLVPHGYLSEEEGEKDEDERPLSPSAAKEQLKLKEEQFERELKEKTCQIKPSLIGCCWLEDTEPHLLKVLQRYAAVVFAASTPICLNINEMVCENGESPMTEDAQIRSEKATKRRVIDTDIPTLIRILHGISYSKNTIIKEFLHFLERNRTEEAKNGPSKAQILAKISEIATWSKCSEAGGRTCWVVNPEVLERYNLAELPTQNSWEFTIEIKKRTRKNDDSRNDEDTPPAKTPRVSLIKKFAQNPAPPLDSPPAAEPSTPKAKKRVALISLATSSSKKPRSESKPTPLTNFLKKMSSKKPPQDADGDMDGIECLD